MDLTGMLVYGGVILATVSLPLLAVYFTWKNMEE
jgi:hypothetical protein